MRGFIPPYVLEHIARAEAATAPEQTERSLELSRGFRAERALHATARLGEVRAAVQTGGRPAAIGERAPDRLVHDAGGREELPGEPARAEGEAATGDAAVDEAFDGLGDTWRLLWAAFGRDSLDGAGMRLEATVHYGERFQNAFWDGERMVFGDGDGELFVSFTASLDVIGDELAHGLLDHTAPLDYQAQSGALNESIADAFGAMVRQFAMVQQAEEADWLIGADLLAPGVQAKALRSMLEPGTAYDDPRLGVDPQPAHMRDYVQTVEDHGGVHINSGIPNRAFALASIAAGGATWETTGLVWYDVLLQHLPRDCTFQDFAARTVAAAEARFGAGPVVDAVREGWEQVGVLEAAVSEAPAPAPPSTPAPASPDSDSPTPGPASELLLRRSGGVTGVPRERTVRLEELGGADAERWRGLLSERRLQQFAGAAHPDAFVYRIVCRDAACDVVVSEPQLPHDVRSLFRRTLDV